MNIGDFSGGKIVKECFLSTLEVIALLILKFFEKSLGAHGDQAIVLTFLRLPKGPWPYISRQIEIKCSGEH